MDTKLAIKLNRHPLIPRNSKISRRANEYRSQSFVGSFPHRGLDEEGELRYARHFLKLAKTTSNCRVIPMTWEEEDKLEKKLQKKRKKYRAVYRKAHKRGR